MATLVTGGGGFIGSHVVRHLVNRGKKVRVLHLPGEDLRNISDLNVELIRGNVLDRESVARAMEGCKRVYHLAAVYAFWLPDPKVMFDVNVGGSRNVFDECLRLGVKKVVHTSSMVVFGGQGTGVSGSEQSPFMGGRTGELYSISKFESHLLAEQYAKDGLNLSIVCPTLPLGPGDITPTPTGNYIVNAAKQPVVLYTDTTTNIGDVRDIAMGHLLAMKKGKRGRSYILGGQRNYTMKEFLQAVDKVRGKQRPAIKVSHQLFEAIGYLLEMNAEFITRKAPVITSQSARASALGLSADISRAREELGYTCRPLEESIRDAFDWFVQNDFIGS
jgi:dihydroflavonol-4-reductase